MGSAMENGDHRLSEWVIRIAFVALALIAVLAVFGEDLAALYAPSQERVSKAEAAVRGGGAEEAR